MVVKSVWEAPGGEGGDKKPPGEGGESPAGEEGKDAVTPTWRQFTENTTFHGIRYVFQDTTWFRKVFWLGIILGSATFFVVQVGRRIDDYYHYQTVTSVKRVSENSLSFPAVTLCNLNQYRVSEADKMGLYDYLNRQLVTKEQLDDPVLRGIGNSTDVIRRLGHQIDRLIDSCQWQGQPCDIERDFETRILDIGLCHTFNAYRRPLKTVKQAGLEGGLQLLLNIEEFEHMRGSNLDSGVKFLLHEPADTPSLKNLGFVAASGQHTFVAIKQLQMRSLSSPWGDCKEGGGPVGTCKHDCYSHDFLDHCNCTDTSMAPSSTWPECDLPTKLTCGCNANLKDSSSCGTNCSCPSPCEERIYRPTLSASMLSSINLDMFTLKAPGVLDRTNRMFLEASETRLRLEDTFNATFLTPAKVVLDSLDKISEIYSKYDKAENTSYMSLLFPLAEFLYTSKSYFDPQLLLDGIQTDLLGNECNVNTIRVGGFIDTVTRLLRLVIQAKEAIDSHPQQCTTSEDYLHYLDRDHFCHAMYLGGVYTKGFCDTWCSFTFSSIKLWTSWDPCHSGYPACICCYAGLLKRQLKKYEKVYSDIKHIDTYFWSTLIQYKWLVQNWESVPDTEYCNNASKFYQTDDVILPTIIPRLTHLSDSKITFDQFYTFINDTYTLTIDRFRAEEEDDLKYKYLDVCCWPRKYLYMEYPTYPNGTQYHDNGVAEEKRLYEDAIFRFHSMAMSDYKADIDTIVLSGLGRVLSAVRPRQETLATYVTSREITTRQLARDIVDSSMYRQVAAIVSETGRHLEAIVGTQRRMQGFVDHMESYVMSAMMLKKIPLTTDIKAATSPLFKFLRDRATEEKLHKFITDKCKNTTLQPGVESAEILLFIKFACTFNELLQEDIGLLTTAAREFEISVDSLLTKLLVHIEETQMNRIFFMSNFLQVDLYYEELQYELIEEQKAFVLGSLFSEVGGFLGLLLGASIITVCELVDYLLLLLGQRLKKRNITPDKQQEHEQNTSAV